MHVTHGTYRTGSAGSLARGRPAGAGLQGQGSSGNLSADGDAVQPSPHGSPGSVGGRSSTALESHIRRIQHAFSVFFGRVSAKHTDFMAKRGLLTRMLLAIVESVTVVFALTVIGTVIFSALERSSDHLLEARYASVMAEVRGNISPDSYDALLYFVQNPREGDAWALSHQSSYMFAFSTVTSIGYGVFTPVTQGGQVFFCFYALVCIPLCGISFGRVATSVVDLLSWFQACHRKKIRQSFKNADKESRGYISQDEMRSAIEAALRYTVDVTELEELVDEIDPDDSNRISLKMYAWAFSQLGSLDERALQKAHRVRLAALSFAIWNIIGMAIFHHSEGWSWVESIYFCFETLLTIGLGDYVPKSTVAVRFHFIFCVLGLGMLASLITAITELDLAEQSVARAAVEAVAREKLRRISETNSRRGSLEPSTPPVTVTAAPFEQGEFMEERAETPQQSAESSDFEQEEEPDAGLARAGSFQRQVPPAARVDAGGPMPLPLPPADVRLRPTPPNSPPWFVPQSPAAPPPLLLHSDSNGLVSQSFIARGAEERARARAERAARVSERRMTMAQRVEEDALHANAAQQHRRILSPAEWSDA